MRERDVEAEIRVTDQHIVYTGTAAGHLRKVVVKYNEGLSDEELGVLKRAVRILSALQDEYRAARNQIVDSVREDREP